jgi:DNA-binding CsgD family transcriptional regulator/tetratricopeptide (TPR) repeat protein
MRLGDDAGASCDLAAALDTESDPDRRVAIALSLAEALAGSGAMERAAAMLEETGRELGGEAAMRLRVQETSLALFDPERAVDAQQRMLGFAALAGDTPAERIALSSAAIASAFDPRAHAADVAEMARRALADGRLAGDELAPSAVVGPPIYALTMAGDLDAADRELEHVRARARVRGSPVDFHLYEVMRLEACRQRGELGLAAAHGVSAVSWARDWGDSPVALRVLSIGLSWLVEVLLEQGDAAGAQELVDSVEAVHDLASRPELAWGLQARGLLAMAAGRPAEALEDFTVVAATARAVGYEDRTTPWRLHTARAMAATGDDAGALALTAEELALCRTWGSPAPLAAALRAHAMIGPPEQGAALLEEALELVAGSVFRLETARVAADLGIARRREGSRAAAREMLQRAADYAAACGAVAIAERARAELVVLGARPRRLRINGVDALTPSERRVAVLAAAGRTNREIAQELFVTLKTVETHLSKSYRKLDVAGRDALPALLGAAVAVDAAAR